MNFGFGSAGSQPAAQTPQGSSNAPTSNGEAKCALFSLLIFKTTATPNQPVLLVCSLDLGSFPFFQRRTIREHILFHSRLIAARTPPGKRQCVEFEQNLGNCYVYNHSSGLCVTVLSTASYPMRVAFGLINHSIRTFQEKYSGKWEQIVADQSEGALFPEASEILKTYQNPLEADKLLKVQKDLDEVKDVMLKNIDELLQRGEKLDDLMQRSEDLSSTSYMFYRRAKKNNQCCSMY